MIKTQKFGYVGMRYFNMRKVCIAIVFLLVFLCSCTNSNIRSEESLSYQTKLVNKVIDCFSSENSEELKMLFCKDVQNSSDFDVNLREAMSFFEGKVITYNEHISVGDGISYEDGIIAEKHIVPVIFDIETDAKKTYKITFFAYEIYAHNENYVGITNIIIRDDKDNTYQLGYAIY